MSDVSPLEIEMAKLIVQTLTLKVDPARIQPEEPLFGDGLGLDSIDALELSLAISQPMGIRYVQMIQTLSPPSPHSVHSADRSKNIARNSSRWLYEQRPVARPLPR